MSPPRSIFGEISIEQFLNDYWQKKPLFVRGAWPDFHSPVSREALIELACRDDALSRLIMEEGGEYPWEALFGPFEREDLIALPESCWTLLVQEVERHVPEVSHLLDAFPFLPNWRFDDIMVSLASDRGGVGAHIDNYDVFLVQGEGNRLWQIDAAPVAEEVLIPDLDVRILSSFVPTDEWTVEPGDLLYLPPRVAHYGVAVGSCMTYSLGCRAPSASDLVTAFFEDYLEGNKEGMPFTGERLDEGVPPGMLHPDLKSFARSALLELVDREAAIDRWLGRFLSRSVRGSAPSESDSIVESNHIHEHLSGGGIIRAILPSQILFDRLSRSDLVLFVGGEEHEVHPDLEWALEKLTGRSGLSLPGADALGAHPDFIQLLATLVQAGYFALEGQN